MEKDLFQQNQVSYINSLKDKNGYKFSHYSETSSLPTSFSIMSLFALGATDILSNEKRIIVNFLANKLNKIDLIVDEKYFHNEITSRNHDTEYVINQTTFFSFIALDILGTTIKKLEFLTPFYDPQFLESWVKKRFEGNFWAESNKLMFLFYFFAYVNKYGSPSEKTSVRIVIDRYFNLLDEHQDKTTGYWGHGKSLFRKAYGAAHLYLFYDYFEREIPFVDRILDSTLLLHARNGLAETAEGGACEDYDLIEIYLRVLKQTNYKRDEVISKLITMRKTILVNTNSQGGFPYKFYRWPFLLHRVLQVRPSEKIAYSYSSLRSMTTPVYYPDCWATFFRNLSLNAIDLVTDKKRVPSYGLPGWGFLYKN